MARRSKKEEVNCGNNASTRRKTRQKEPQKRLSRQKAAVDEAKEPPSSRGQPNSLNQATISHFFCPLEVDNKKVQITISGSSAGTNSNLSSKGKIASRKYKQKKSKAKQLEEIKKYNKKIPMFFDYVNPEKAKEIEPKNGRTKSARSKKDNDELLRNQRQLTEFYDLIETISELSISKMIRKVDSNLEDGNILEDGSNTFKKDKIEIPEKSTKIINRDSINFDNDMDCNSPLITSPLQHMPPDTLSYHLSNFSIEPNDSFITMSSLMSSPKVTSNTTINELEVGNTPTKTRMKNNRLLDTMQVTNSDKCNNVTNSEKSRCNNVSSHIDSNIMTDQIEEPHYNNSSVCNNCNNINNEKQDNSYGEMSHIGEGSKNIIIREITDDKDKMIIDNEMNVTDQVKNKLNDSVVNVEDGSQPNNVNESLHNKMHPKDKNQSDKSHCYSWEDEIIDLHKEPLENKNHRMHKSFMIHKKQLEKEDSFIQENNMDEDLSLMIQKERSKIQEINLNENSCLMQKEQLENEDRKIQETNLKNEDTINNQSSIDFHCCSQSENKCEFHRIHDLLDKENYNPDSISTFESLNDPISTELNDISNQKDINTRQDRLLPTDYIRSSARFLKGEVSPAPSPPSLLSQTTLAMIPQSAWDTLPSLNISTLDFEELNDDLL